MHKFAALAVVGFALTITAASAQSVEQREYSMQRRIAEAIEHNRISPRDAARLEREMDKVARHIDQERREHRGRLTPHEWERLNRELDKVEIRLREAERYARYDDRRDRRYQRDGFYERDRDWRRDQ